MPALEFQDIHDLFNLTRSTFIKNRWDSTGLAQLYPKYEIVNQYVRARRAVEDTSDKIESTLEQATASSDEETGINHPLETNATKQAIKLSTQLKMYRTAFTWSDFESPAQGPTDDTKLLDAIQMRFIKNDRNHWEGREQNLLSTDFEATDGSDVKFRGIPYWVTDGAGVTRYSQFGGDDPISTGRAGITKAAQPRFTNAVGVFSKVSQDDFFDLISRFLNNVYGETLVPHPQVAPEAPSQVCYVQDPVKRAIERVLTASNENLGDDAGFYRDACYYRDIPFVLWHALQNGPVAPATGVAYLLDWNSFMIQVHSAFNRKVMNGEVSGVPGQNWEAMFTKWNIHCTRPDRNMRLRTSTTSLQPNAV